VVLKKPKGRKENYRNPEVKDLVIKELKSRGQTKDLSSRRCLGGLYSKINSLEMELT